jgi:hypothetical protein
MPTVNQLSRIAEKNVVASFSKDPASPQPSMIIS